MKLLVVLLLLLPLSLDAQKENGALSLDFNGIESEDYLDYKVYIIDGLDDTLLVIPVNDWRVQVELPPGIYDVHVYNSIGIVYTLDFIEIKSHMELSYSFSMYESDYFPYYNNDTIAVINTSADFDESFWVNTNVDLYSGLPIDSRYNFAIGLGAKAQLNLRLTDWINFGFLIGWSYEYHNLNQYDFTTPELKFNHQYYSYLNVSPGIEFAFTTKKRYPIFNLGIRYLLPLYTRLNQKEGDVKHKTKKIHNFNDVRAFVAMGYKFIQVFGEYRIGTFMKGDLPDIPRWFIGLRLNFGEGILSY